MKRISIPERLDMLESIVDRYGRYLVCQQRLIDSQKEELGGQLKMIGNIITMVSEQDDKIKTLEYTVEDLEKTHGFYSDHIKLSSNCVCRGND